MVARYFAWEATIHFGASFMVGKVVLEVRRQHIVTERLVLALKLNRNYLTIYGLFRHAIRNFDSVSHYTLLCLAIYYIYCYTKLLHNLLGFFTDLN